MDLSSDIKVLKGVGGKRAELLLKLGIDSVGALYVIIRENMRIGHIL